MEETLLLLKEDVQVITELNLNEVPQGQITRYWLSIVTNGIGMPIRVPVIIARGYEDGNILGLTAAIHGNELNGVALIQRLFREIDVHELQGMIVGVPVMNIPALLRNQRGFIDGCDLNLIMPGNAQGNISEVYAHRLMNQIVKHFDYLVDIHTASFGRVNSYHVRTDLGDPITREMAMLQNAQIIIHNPPSDGTLRGAAAALGIKAITLELGNPNTFQKGLIRSGLSGIHNLLTYLGIVKNGMEQINDQPILCKTSYWMHTDDGGVLSVIPNVTDFVKKGDRIATLRNIFGDLIKEYCAPEDGVVIGRSVNPINQTGGRILHLGIV
ncbi:MAG: succinylglutamate desuccinylase/aspartoacylase family protein [Saprospiraceae bacterium]|nr:succinylglutamate desuccinylase/aspartoacylase family protein [Saprospiraceae bacterium]